MAWLRLEACQPNERFCRRNDKRGTVKGLSLKKKVSMNILKYTFFLLFLLSMTTSLQAQKSTDGEKQTTAIPSSADAVDPLKEGNDIPAVNLMTPEGEPFDLNTYVQEQPVVLIFYRGGWCPYCNVHLQELMEADAQLREMGYEILAVSPDTPEKLAESQQKHEMTYRLLSDKAMKAAKSFGVAYQADAGTAKKYRESGIALTEGPAENQYLLPVPSVFIIDRQGSIRYSYVNADFRTRIKIEDLLQEAKNAR